MVLHVETLEEVLELFSLIVLNFKVNSDETCFFTLKDVQIEVVLLHQLLNRHFFDCFYPIAWVE